ncbi:hypothetical protein NQD34_008848 [Periophthalmus magnuspinnatus]|nr:hypothetical protein NQD34_008848 [Periophthalmus magnuspinnatus]
MAVKMLPIYIFLWLMLEMTSARPQYLGEKMFTFPEETNMTYVKVNASAEDLAAITICLRTFTDLTRAYSLFSLSTPSSVNEILLYKQAQAKNKFVVQVGDGVAAFVGQNYDYYNYYYLNKWQSICTTWDAETGLVQLWINGKASSRKFVSHSNITGNFTVVLGQDQNPEEGRLHRSRSFVGMMRDIQMWNYVHSEMTILNYHRNDRRISPKGNVFDWQYLDFDIIGNVVVEPEQKLSNN